MTNNKIAKKIKDGIMLNNGTSLSWKVIIVCIIPILFFMGKGIIENDRIRQQEDKEIRQEIVRICVKQQETNEKVAVMMERIMTKLEVIEKKIR